MPSPANLTDCDELDLAWSDCDWEDFTVADVDSALLAQEEFMILFWFKDLGALEHPPVFRFFSSLEPVTMEMQFGRLSGGTYMFDIFNLASQKHFQSGVDRRFYNPGKWNSVTIGWQQHMRSTKYSVELMLNGAPGWKLDVFSANTRTRFGGFRAISVEGNLVISGIEVRAGNWPLSDRQRKNYMELLRYSDDFQGPFLSEQLRTAAAPLEREQMLAGSKPILLAPPILVQSRNNVAVCEGFGATLLERQVQLASRMCTGAYQCLKSGEKVERPEQVRTCSGGPQTNFTHFGLQPRMPAEVVSRVSRAATTYSDFLFSIDAPVVVRDGQTRTATDVLDLRTTRAQVLMAFYTPEIHAASVLRIDISLEGLVPDVSWRIGHLVITSGNDLKRTRMAFMLLNLSLGFLLFITVAILARTLHKRGLRRCCAAWCSSSTGVSCLTNPISKFASDPDDVLLRLGYGKRKPVHGFSYRAQFFVCCLDLALIAITWIIASFQLVHIQSSASNVESSIGNMAKLQWENETVPFQVKLDNFFSMTEKTQRALASQDLQDGAAFTVLLTIIGRLIFATSVHPRIGLLPTSLKYGFSDLIHFAMMFTMLFLLFALLGTLFLGPSRKEFVDLKTTCGTQLSLMIGELPVDWNTDIKTVTFVSIHFIVFFFFLLNFLLATIVEAYMRTRKKNEQYTYTRSFFTDLILCYYHKLLGWRLGWPKGHDLLKFLPRVGHEDERPQLTTDDLLEIFNYKEESLRRFMTAYENMCHMATVEEIINSTEIDSSDGQIEMLHEKVTSTNKYVKSLHEEICSTNWYIELLHEKIDALAQMQQIPGSVSMPMREAVVSAMEASASDESAAFVTSAADSALPPVGSVVTKWSEHDVATYVRGLEEFGARAIDYAEAMSAEHIDGKAFVLLTAEELKELGFSMGHRKNLLARIEQLRAPAAAETSLSLSCKPGAVAMPMPRVIYRAVGKAAMSQMPKTAGPLESQYALKAEVGFQGTVTTLKEDLFIFNDTIEGPTLMPPKPQVAGLQES